tara:strand:+ start:3219 stop:4244 length:1026 start_codon:yes stop_codon:yes gene_type:complete
MSPFRSSKNNITSSSSSVRAVEGRDTLGAFIGRNSAFETWTYGNYRYYSFTGDGFFEVIRSGPIDVAIIGGGGAGGGDDDGGGGGAGAFVENYNVTFPIGRYDVVIGRGGQGARYAYPAQPGGSSKLVGPSNFTDITALGGANGAGSSQQAGLNLGSGGGASLSYNKSEAFNFAHGSPGGNQKPQGGGGGGGAGSPGSYYDPANVFVSPDPVGSPINSPGATGMIGGNGKAMFGGDLGIPENYGYNTPNTPYAANGRHFAGGGGGGDRPGGVYTGYMLNPGGGGAVSGTGSNRLPDSPLRHLYEGDPNTGSGGTGGSSVAYLSGKGGDGILIIRIPIVFAE